MTGENAENLRLQHLHDDALERWGLTFAHSLTPGETGALVSAVLSDDDLVLKVSPIRGAAIDDESLHEAEGLIAWRGRGAVEVVAHERVANVSLILMERARPGAMLAHSLSAGEVDGVVVGMLRQLWIPEAELPADHPFRPLEIMCDRWAASAEARLGADPRGLPADVVELGLRMFRELPRDWRGDQVLLATDLHHFNIVSAVETPGTALSDWRVIDPKPYVGDPHYDVLQHMLNYPERLLADAAGFVERVAGLAGLDRDRVLRWLFARCVQESGQFPWTQDVALRVYPLISGYK